MCRATSTHAPTRRTHAHTQRAEGGRETGWCSVLSPSPLTMAHGGHHHHHHHRFNFHASPQNAVGSALPPLLPSIFETAGKERSRSRRCSVVAVCVCRNACRRRATPLRPCRLWRMRARAWKGSLSQFPGSTPVGPDRAPRLGQWAAMPFCPSLFLSKVIASLRFLSFLFRAVPHCRAPRGAPWPSLPHAHMQICAQPARAVCKEKERPRFEQAWRCLLLMTSFFSHCTHPRFPLSPSLRGSTPPMTKTFLCACTCARFQNSTVVLTLHDQAPPHVLTHFLHPRPTGH